MQIDLGRPEVPAQRFVITEVITSVVGKRIRGWEGEEGRPEARLGENSNAVRSESEMFFEIEVETENMGSVRVDSDDILKNALRKDFGKFPRGLQDIYFLLYDWLNGYDLEKRRSKNRDGSWGSTISFKLRGTEFYGLQISPAGDIHLRFNKQKFEAAGIFPKLEHAILKEIQPLSKQKPRGTGNNVTSTGIKIILTAHDSGLVDVIINQLSPLVDTVCGQAPSLKVE